MALSRASIQLGRTGQRAFSVGVSHQEAVNTYQLWKKIGFLGTAICVAFGAKEVAAEMSHDHPHKTVFYPHERKRAKVFAWEAHNCDFFDLECKKGGAHH